jgi:hypothetical protein
MSKCSVKVDIEEACLFYGSRAVFGQKSGDLFAGEGAHVT